MFGASHVEHPVSQSTQLMCEILVNGPNFTKIPSIPSNAAPCWRTEGQTWRSSWSLVVNLPWRRPQTTTHTKMNITPVAAQTKDVFSARVFLLAFRLWLCIKQSDIFFPPLLETQRPLCTMPQEHSCHGKSWRMRDSYGLKLPRSETRCLYFVQFHDIRSESWH